MLSIVIDIPTALDEAKISVLLLLDLSAAFDTIDHDILLSRLDSSFGIRSTALSWFHSYLSERRQFVTVQDHKSPTTSLDFRVPQGSVLGPVLLIIYTTPLSHLIEKHSVNHEMFADDTQLCKSAPPTDYDSLVLSLQKCTADVKDWMLENKLKLNDGKQRPSVFLLSHLALLTHFYPPSLLALATFSSHRKS